MNKAFKLEDLQVYKESLFLVKEIFDISKEAGLNREFALVDQLKRASISVCVNIAEGYGRRTKADFAQFLSISLGSCNEVQALLDIVRINFAEIEILPLKKRYIVLSKRIFVFRKNLI